MTANQEAWLKALESDEFSQTKGTLQSERGFCCLGVACVLAERSGVAVRRHPVNNQIGGGCLATQPSVREWLGLKTDTGQWSGEMGDSLAYLNDDGRTFKEIAAIVRAKPERFFVN